MSRPDAQRFPASVFGVGSEPDARFTLANERTFLAWIRTALALVAGGVALETLGLDLHAGLRLAASLVLIVAGSGEPLRSARSMRIHQAHAIRGSSVPATISTIDAASRRPGWRSSPKVSRATPPATSAREVRIQARKVRSLARENRASGSEPTRNTDPGNRRPAPAIVPSLIP